MLDAPHLFVSSWCMRIIPSRDLVASPAKVWKLLEDEGSVVITKDGKPRGILLPTSDVTETSATRDPAPRKVIDLAWEVRRLESCTCATVLRHGAPVYPAPRQSFRRPATP